MSAVQVIPVSKRAGLTRFIRVPSRLYASDPQWITPLEAERRAALSVGRNPFFQHAEAQLFLAHRNGSDIGRISAQIDRLASEPELGFFGSLAAANEAQVIDVLFEAAESWLRERGKTRVRGPFNLSINEESGLLVAGFDTPPMILMPHNPAYLAAHVERNGYGKAKDLIAYWYDFGKDLPAAARRLIDRQKRSGIRVRTLDTRAYDAEFETIKSLLNDAWRENWGFVPFTDAEFEHLAKELKPLLVPDLLVIAEMSGEPIGFGLLLPNLYELIRDFSGRLAPFNWLKLLLRLKRGATSGRTVLMGVRRSYQGGLAGGAVPYFMIDTLRKNALAHGMRSVELSWILEDNMPMRRIIESLDAKAYKTYRIYEKALT